MDASYYAHYLHHKYFEVNYADGMVPLDKWFGSFHDGTPEAHEAMNGAGGAAQMRRGIKAHEHEGTGLMEKRQVGRTDALGLGGAPLGGNFIDLDYRQAAELTEDAIGYFDRAKLRPANVSWAMETTAGGQPWTDMSSDYDRSRFEDNLQRLGLDRIAAHDIARRQFHRSRLPPGMQIGLGVIENGCKQAGIGYFDPDGGPRPGTAHQSSAAGRSILGSFGLCHSTSRTSGSHGRPAARRGTLTTHDPRAARGRRAGVLDKVPGAWIDLKNAGLMVPGPVAGTRPISGWSMPLSLSM